MKRSSSLVLSALVLGSGAFVCSGDKLVIAARIMPAAAGKGMVNLPYHPPGTDTFGNSWYIYQGGWIRQQGNMPVYSEGAMLLINGNQPQMTTNQARLEENGNGLALISRITPCINFFK